MLKVASPPKRERLEKPSGVTPIRVWWEYVGVIGLIHLLALYAFWPWLFSWTGVISVFVGHHLFGMFGMTVGYHRLLTHRSFQCPLWLEHTFAILGVCCLQDTPARWVATHRVHHQHSDEQEDPHTPLVNFLWSQVGWLMVKDRNFGKMAHLDRYARDVVRDPFYLWLERGQNGLLVFIAHAFIIYLIGGAIGYFTGGWSEAWRMSWSLLVWGVFVRTVFVWHITWAVNSLTHMFGYRTYQTSDDSRNNWLIGLLSHGEGWHNNHHALPTAAAHGRRWWELDLSYRVICCLEAVGLAWNVARPDQKTATKVQA
ncbi:fatty acid desaturase [Blastopirellula sp. J2-11]|uniref:acyl-CoA desaturase n=1 Tax=Blastopirellula sp. J2-11 TaxID=2943192 RepID=UPI0021C8B9C2|nr:fatty acid desaturase [Blastopirellula sp. J2-11]UUO05728.1 fatty acid desaturase [Blastopirellula sp. J2-11]